MISGRTFAREMIALRQRETKRTGRILALQGQNPGQLELRTHSEFGANLSVAPGALPSSVLELSLEEAVQPDIILSGSALRKQNHSIFFSIQRCQTPGTKDSYTHLTTPSAGRTGGVLTCLTKSLHKIENGQSHPSFTHFLLHYYELKIISLPITLHYAISHGLAPRIFHSHL